MLRQGSSRKGWRSSHDLQQRPRWKPVVTDVYTMVPFTWIRCLVFLGSMALYTTDVVRSGLGIYDLATFGKQKVGIDMFSAFGPYAYPAQKIVRVRTADNQSDEFHAVAINNAGVATKVDQVKVWTYKSDTLAVGLRGLAEQLEVKEYPKCLLTTKPVCPSAFLSLETTFWMLDALVEAVQKRFLKGQSSSAFAVEHKRVDTVEQTIFALLRNQPFIRYFTIHSYQQNATKGQIPVQLLAICGPENSRASVCSTLQWKAKFLLLENGTNTTSIKVHEHIALRFARLQAQHPDLDFELLLFAARNSEWVANSASVAYNRDCEEMVALARGRKCERSNSSRCETIVIDDFRYERSNLETNVEELFGIIAFIRGLAQVYVWLRVILLVAGVAWSTWYETNHESNRAIKVLYRSWVNLLKVPSHVVVYGTLFPVAMYALAYFTDCYIYHHIVQDALATILGNVAILHVNTAVLYVTLKMRNIWFIALFCTGVVAYKTHYRHSEGWRHREGIPGFRGSMFSFLSFSTLLFPIRFPILRQIDNWSVTRHDITTRLNDVWLPMRLEFSPASSGPFLEARCFLLAGICWIMLLPIVKAVAILFKRPMPPIMAQSTVIPYSAGTLWSTNALTGYWHARLAVSRRRGKETTFVAPKLVEAGGLQFVVDPTPSHVRALQLQKRKGEVWSLVRLMNVVMMTDPWVFLRLRFVGVQLYLYRFKQHPKKQNGGMIMPHNSFSGASPGPDVAFLLPDRLEKLYEMNQVDDADRFEFVGVVNSTSLTWNELIMCG